MKSELKKWLCVVAMFAVIVGLVVAPAPGAFAAGQQLPQQPGIVLPDGNVFGMTYGDWSAAWWQYVLSIPAGTNPFNDVTGANCGVGQSSGPVFFLVGGADVTRQCAVPAGKTLVFPILNAECSTVEPPPFFGSNGQELRTCAAAWGDAVGVDTLQVTIDEKKVRNLGHFRAQSPVFDFIMPAADNFLGLPGVTSGTAVSDGYWVIVEPLSPGDHVIHFEGVWLTDPCPGCFQRVTYNLIVTK